MTRKLLILTYYFPPCAAVAVHRMVGLVRHLPRFGWESIVVAPPNPPHEPTDPALVKSVPSETTTVIPTPFPEGYWGKINRRFAPNLLWKHRAWKALMRAIREHRPAAILSSMPPHTIQELALSLHKRFGLPWIADFRDPLYTMSHPTPTGLRGWSFARLERQTMTRADRVIGISPLFSDGLRQAHPEYADKIITITNGYEPEAFADTHGPPPRDRLSILYTGELYFGRDPRPFLDALQELETSPSVDVPKVGFEFLGRWTEQYDLPAEVTKRGLGSAVTVGGLVPHRECLRKMTQADILLLIHTPGYVHGLPAKIFEYLGARRPILVLTEHAGDIGCVLKESGILHRIAPLHDPAAIKQAIIELAREVKNGTPVVPDDGHASFTRADMAHRFAEQLDAIVPAHATSLRQPALASAS
jgi:glycosyltransferase involved in cell wall biosynthesis